MTNKSMLLGLMMLTAAMFLITALLFEMGKDSTTANIESYVRSVQGVK